MVYCKLCRVDDTPAHQASEFHAYNATLQLNGKMPLSKEIFDRFEANKGRHGGDSNTSDAAATTIADAASSSSSSTSSSSSSSSSASSGDPPSSSSSSSSSSPPPAGADNKHNVNNWHWAECSITDWAHTQFRQQLLDTPIDVECGSLRVTGVTSVDGDANVMTRKGKLRLGYELRAAVTWAGTISDADGSVIVDVTGTAEVPDFDDSMCDEEERCADMLPRLTVAVDDAHASKTGADMLLSVMRSKGRPALLETVTRVIAAMQEKRARMETGQDREC